MHHDATFTFTAATAVGFRCALLKSTRARNKKKPKAHFSRCSSPKIYGHLKPGRYTFEVRAVAGLTPGPITKKKFTI